MSTSLVTPTGSAVPPCAIAAVETLLPPVPTYGPDGRRWPDRSHEKAEWLLANGAVIAKRDRKGRIRAIQYKELSGAGPLKTPPSGTRFIFRESVLEQFRIWQHKKPNRLRLEPEPELN